MLVFLLALLLCEVLAEPLGERPAHPVPEELFLRSFLTFPGGPLLGHCCSSWLRPRCSCSFSLPYIYCQVKAETLYVWAVPCTGPQHLPCALAELPCRPLPDYSATG